MASLIDRIRQKPEHIRIRYLFLSVGASFLFVVVIWMFSLGTSMETLSDAPSDIKSMTTPIQPTARELTKSIENIMDEGTSLSNSLTEQSFTEGEPNQSYQLYQDENEVDTESTGGERSFMTNTKPSSAAPPKNQSEDDERLPQNGGQ